MGKSSFFSSLPGILTGIATLITAGAAVAAIAVGSGDKSKRQDGGAVKGSTSTVVVPGGGATETKPAKDERTLEEWAHDADEICAIVYDNVRALGVLDDPAATWQVLPQLLEISAQGNERIAALERPKDAADKIAESLKQASIAETALRSAYDAYNLGDATTGGQYWAAYTDANLRAQQLDTELGSTVCAHGP